MLGDRLVGLDGHVDVERLERDLDLIEVEVLENLHVLEGVFDHGLHQLLALGTPVNLLGPCLLDRPGIYPDPNRNLALLTGAHDGLDLLTAADVAGIDSQAVHAGFGRHEGQPVVKVNIGHERRVGARADVAERLAGVLVGHGQAHDVAAGFNELVDLGERGGDVTRIGDRHGLHADWCPAANLNVADLDGK